MNGRFEQTVSPVQADSAVAAGMSERAVAAGTSERVGSAGTSGMEARAPQADSARGATQVSETGQSTLRDLQPCDSIPLEGGIMSGDSLAVCDSIGSPQPADPAAPDGFFDPAGLIGDYGRPDSIQWPWTPEPARKESQTAAAEQGPGIWQDTTSRALFGNTSTLASSRRSGADLTEAPTDNIPFQCFVLALAAVYAILLYRNVNDIGALLNRVFHEATSRKRLSEDSGNGGFSHFLRITNIIGMLFLGLLTVKFGGWIAAGIPAGPLDEYIMLMMSLATTVAVSAVTLYQRILLQCAGAITVSRPFIAQLIQLKRTYFAMAVIGAAPVLLLFVLTTADSARLWLYLLLFESAVAAILYLKESLGLFLSKNISILHWFLYLCAVELFPVSLIWLLITRGYASM